MIHARLHVAVVAACPFPEPRGTPVRVLRLSEATARLGHRVSVLTYHLGSGEDPPLLDVHRIPNVASYSKRGPGPSVGKFLKLDPMLQRLVRRFFQDEDVDVVHAHHYEGLLVASSAARGLDIPIVYDAHTLLSSELPEYRFPVPKPLLKGIGSYLDRRIPARADHVVAVTDAIRSKLIALGLPEDRVTVTSQGVEDEFFVPNAGAPPVASAPAGTAVANPGAARGNGDFAPDRNLVVFAGNLAAYQGIEALLEAFAVVRKRRPDTRLRILSSSDFAPYQALAERLKIRDAIDLEAVDLAELPRALGRAAVTVNPRTECDGIPIKLLNYMAAARPIVSFEGSFPVRGAEPLAMLVPDGDAEAFGNAIVALLEDPAGASRLGDAGRRYAERHHRWGAIATDVDRIYRRLVSRRDPGR